MRDIDIAADGGEHRIVYRHDGIGREARTRWLVDACGRAGLIRKKRELAEPNGHDANAVWFRIKERIAIDEWSDDPAWRSRCTPPARWLSTNHLVGAGYWAWLIPLASGSHSVGIVADAKLHPLETMNTFEKAMDWLEAHQPRLFDALDDKRHLLQDFAFLRRFSYGCKQVFSAERWALTGEAGLFLDPFYSPGTDFIAIANTYICELVGRDRAGKPLAACAQVFDQVFHSFYESTLALYRDQYPIFGDPEVLPVKVIWDYTYYWGVLAQFFFQRRLADLASLSALRAELAHCQALNVEVQALLRAWSAARPTDSVANPAVMLDQAALPWFAELNRSLADPRDDDAAFRDRIRASTRQMRALADRDRRARWRGRRRCGAVASRHRGRRAFRHEGRLFLADAIRGSLTLAWRHPAAADVCTLLRMSPIGRRQSWLACCGYAAPTICRNSAKSVRPSWSDAWEQLVRSARGGQHDLRLSGFRMSQPHGSPVVSPLARTRLDRRTFRG